jgi:hypothetical protein
VGRRLERDRVVIMGIRIRRACHLDIKLTPKLVVH